MLRNDNTYYLADVGINRFTGNLVNIKEPGNLYRDIELALQSMEEELHKSIGMTVVERFDSKIWNVIYTHIVELVEGSIAPHVEIVTKNIILK